MPDLVFLLGPSGSGKSAAGAASAQRGYLHLEMDGASRTPPLRSVAPLARLRFLLAGLPLSGAAYAAITAEGLTPEWVALTKGDPNPMASSLRMRAERTNARGVMLTFPSGVGFSKETIAAANGAGIRVRILYGTANACIASFLERERVYGRGLTATDWVRSNHTYEKFGAPELEHVRIAAWRRDGTRRPLEEIVDAIVSASPRERTDPGKL